LIKIDLDRIIILIYSLLENASRYSPPGSVIDVEVGRNSEGVMISILDRGMGVPDNDRERIFNRFYQVGDALHHSIPGMGVGLYVAREIVEAHGGKIWCEPREGGGTAFRFILPQGETGSKG
jgi:two-component system sensor histidine kinase KdpD